MFFLATAATIITSQPRSRFVLGSPACIQLGYLPRLTVLHPSKIEGRIYVPIVNWGLCLG